MKNLRFFAYIGPFLFIVLTIICGALTADYSHISQYVSELGADENQYSFLMNYVGILPFGFSIILFSVFLMRYLNSNTVHIIVFLMLLMTGVLFGAAGIFNCDPGCPIKNVSKDATFHLISAFSAFGLATILQVVLGLHVVSEKFRHPFYKVSLITGLISLLFLIVMFKTGSDYEYKGLYQRLFLLTFCCWLILTGYYSRNPFNIKG